jgi:hypothetical protein
MGLYDYVSKNKSAMSTMVNILSSMFKGQHEINFTDFPFCLPSLEVSQHKRMLYVWRNYTTELTAPLNEHVVARFLQQDDI